MNTYEIHISGVVQGVGFRPFIHRLAMQHGLAGDVVNRNDGVIIRISTEKQGLDRFLEDIRNKAPAASVIDSIRHKEINNINFTDFAIRKSDNVSVAITGVSPDIAVCEDCLEDLEEQDHRIDYPLINCTNCGPRFTIIKSLPYDRINTTMREFVMCETCEKEYTDINDRRFHAQPVACNNCGPSYRLVHNNEHIRDISSIVSKAAGLIDKGFIGSIKGTGGFHLVCDALNEDAVKELRKRKQRDRKPFAVMCRDINTASCLAEIDSDTEKLLSSWQSPVVVTGSQNRLAYSVSNGLNTIGIILPYMPFHYLLFNKLKADAIVFTSANISDEPVIKDNKEALAKLEGIADFFIDYDRDIYNRADDSVLKIMNNKAVMLRRSRGYVPAAIKTVSNTEGIFAAGAELVNSFAMGKGSEVIMGQYIGDLKNKATYDFYIESYNLFRELFRFVPEKVICDLHPDYLSSVFARELAKEKKIPLVKVQHHHAHIVSCMADNGIAGEELMGLSMDGVGLGTDGNIWGAEVMAVKEDSFSRLMHFDYIPIMGADRASKEPWRSGLSYFLKYNNGKYDIAELEAYSKMKQDDIDLYIQGLAKGINTHKYSSAGRLFDAVAALCGRTMIADYHAEAPMVLESMTDGSVTRAYDFEFRENIISYEPMVNQIISDKVNGISDAVIISKFHNTFINALEKATLKVSIETGIKKLALSGGTFQNEYVVNNLVGRLEKKGFVVYLHDKVPPNDGGIALGQLIIGSKTDS